MSVMSHNTGSAHIQRGEGYPGMSLLIVFYTSDTFFFNKLRICGHPEFTKSMGTIFPTAFAHFFLCVTFW